MGVGRGSAWLTALVLSVVLAGCGGTASTTVGARTPTASVSTPDYLRNSALNLEAAGAANRLQARLAHLPGFAYLRIVSSGLEVGRTAAGSAIPARAAAVNRGSGVPLSFLVVRYSHTELMGVASRLGRDHDRLVRQGVHLAGWGPDDDTDTVLVYLDPYSQTAADRLRTTYGSLATVVPHSVAGGAS